MSAPSAPTRIYGNRVEPLEDGTLAVHIAGYPPLLCEQRQGHAEVTVHWMSAGYGPCGLPGVPCTGDTLTSLHADECAQVVACADARARNAWHSAGCVCTRDELCTCGGSHVVVVEVEGAVAPFGSGRGTGTARVVVGPRAGDLPVLPARLLRVSVWKGKA